MSNIRLFFLKCSHAVLSCFWCACGLDCDRMFFISFLYSHLYTPIRLVKQSNHRVDVIRTLLFLLFMSALILPYLGHCCKQTKIHNCLFVLTSTPDQIMYQYLAETMFTVTAKQYLFNRLHQCLYFVMASCGD